MRYSTATLLPVGRRVRGAPWGAEKPELMKQYQGDFIRLALEVGALGFGEFRLKSGRISPYFFNAGLFNSGRAAALLAHAYADALYDSGLAFNMLFGPAYKGIPLVTLTAAGLAERHGLDVPFCFNRKEPKAHGEGGVLIGAPVTGRVVIVDDVITAGTAIRESVELIRQAGAEPAGVLLALDREERGRAEHSAVQEVERDFGIPVVSIIRLRELIEHLEADGAAVLDAVRDYRRRYGTNHESLDLDH